MGTFKVTPTERRTGNTAPSFFVEARTDKEAAKNAVSRSRVLEFSGEWKAVTNEVIGKDGKKKRNNAPKERVKMLILPDYKKNAA